LQILIALVVYAGNFVSKFFNIRDKLKAARKTDMLISYQYLNKCSELRSLKQYWICQIKCSVCSRSLQMLATVLNSLCHWFLRKFVLDLLQCGSKFRNRWWLFL